MASSLFARKPVSLLLKEMGGRAGLRPVLGAIQLTSLGIGAIIGAGIFVVIGLVAKDKAGAATMLSFVIAGCACAFAALCYAEFAAMVPVAGSAYTYAYATLGELLAWIIGWDLLLEYGVGAASVAHGWSHYFTDFLRLLGTRSLPTATPASVSSATLFWDNTERVESRSGYWPAPPSCFSPTSVSIRSRPMPRRHAIQVVTCPSVSSAPSAYARFYTSRS